MIVILLPLSIFFPLCTMVKWDIDDTADYNYIHTPQGINTVLRALSKYTQKVLLLVYT